MREIKFRAWDKEQKRIFMVYGFDKDHVYEDSLDDYTESVHPRNLCELMQYTGLKDENGKEIYEGDIISDGIKGLFLVEWNDDTCKFQFSDGTDINDGIRYGTSKLIMGNIYENPELNEVK
jgi:uncharacterized phage protein (TIGR01671 family)